MITAFTWIHLLILISNNSSVAHSCPNQSIMVQAKTWILKKHFDGFPKDSDFELKVEQLPEPKHGGEMIFVSLFSLLRLEEERALFLFNLSQTLNTRHFKWVSIYLTEAHADEENLCCLSVHLNTALRSYPFLFQRCFWKQCSSVSTHTWGEWIWKCVLN